MTENNQTKNLPIIIAVAVVILIGGGAAWYFTTNQAKSSADLSNVALNQPSNPGQAKQPEVATPSINAATTSGASSTSTSSSTYKDGSYTAKGDYISPGGAESVEVLAVLKDGKISDVTVTPKGNDAKSLRYETMFAQGIKGVIVGKSLNDNLNPGVVNGSSLTGAGFAQAMDAIKLQAAQK
jgi:uncharacterized protein with FMN-binding domain